MGADASKLNDNQRFFCEEYIFDYNATRAYQKAYPDASYDSARASSCQLLAKPNIQAYISELKADLERVAKVSKLMVLHEHKKIAFSSIAYLHDTWIERRAFEELTSEEKACIAEISTQIRKVPLGEDGEKDIEVEYVKLKLYDKQRSLESISKLLGYDEPSKISDVSPPHNREINIIVNGTKSKLLNATD